MNAQKKAIQAVTLKNNDYFKLTNDIVFEKQMLFSKALRENNVDLITEPVELYSILAIGIPELININQYEYIPLIVATKTTSLRNWQVDLKQNMRVVIVDLYTGKMAFTRLFYTHKRMKPPQSSMSKPKPDSDDNTTYTQIKFYTHLRKSLRMIWQQSRYAITVLSYDWLSNTKVFELNDENAKPLPDLEPILATKNLQSTENSRKLISTLSDEQPFIFSIAHKIIYKQSLSINVAVKIDAKNTPVAPLINTESKALIATVVILIRDSSSPVQLDLIIPVKLIETSETEKKIQADFSFEYQNELPANEYQVYLFIGNKVSKPQNLLVE